MSYTKGPWMLRELALGLFDIYSKDASLALVTTWRSGVKGTPEETKANARIMAAAPELLEALKMCTKFLPSPTAFPNHTETEVVRCVNAVLAAIAKAEGKS